MIIRQEKAAFVDSFVDTTIHQGTLSADGKFVFHDQKWVPAQLSPDCNWYAYNNQWQPLNPNSVVLAKSIQSSHSSNINQKTQEKTSQSNGSITPILCLLGMLVILWYVFDTSGSRLTGPDDLAWYYIFEQSWWELANLDCNSDYCASAKNTGQKHVFTSAVCFVYLLVILVIQTMTDDIEDRFEATSTFTGLYLLIMAPLLFIFLIQ